MSTNVMRMQSNGDKVVVANFPTPDEAERASRSLNKLLVITRKAMPDHPTRCYYTEVAAKPTEM